MLVPQFSLRWVLGLTAVAAVMSLVAAMAVRGSFWAAAITIALAALAVAMLVHGAMFFVIWLFSLVAPRSRRPASQRAETPFAASAPPLPGAPAPAGRPPQG
ncbi:MAG: hypothetical protein WD847_17815 [Pirellulales bacterium]|jgi:type IV secretory pathway VirB3-like protein